MAVRLNVPGLARRTKNELVETRDFGSAISAPGFSFPVANATGSALITDRNLESYSGSEIAYRCVQLIANSMASLDLAVERSVKDKGGNDAVELDKENSISQVFNKRANPSVSSVVVKRIAYEQCELQGQSFLYTPRAGNDASSDVVALANIMAPVQPLVANVRQELADYIMPTIMGYQVKLTTGTIYLLPHEVLWMRYPHPLTPWAALPPWRAAKWAADLDRYARQFQAAQFQNGGVPEGVIYLGDLTEDQARRAKTQFEAEHTGTANAGKHMFLFGPLKAEYTRIGRTGVEMGYLDTHNSNAEDILTAFGVPRDLLLGDSTYDNQHSAWVSLWTDTLGPKLELFEADIDRQLLPDPAERAVFDRSKVAALQENTDAIHQRATTAWQADGLRLAEYRAQLGLDPFGDATDDMFFTQLQTAFRPAPIAMPELAPALPEQKSAAPELETRAARRGPSQADVHRAYDRHEARVLRAMSRLATKQRRTVVRKLNKLAERRAKGHEARMSVDDLFDTAYWQEQTSEGLETALDAIWTDGAATMADALGIDFSLVDPHVTAAVRSRLATVSEQITGTTSDALANAIAEGAEAGESISDIAARVKGVFDALIPDEADGSNGYRSVMTARTETITGYSNASILTARESGVVSGKTWLTAGDSCPECSDLEALGTVGLDDSFGDVEGPAAHPGCRCSLTFLVDGGDDVEGVVDESD